MYGPGDREDEELLERALGRGAKRLRVRRHEEELAFPGLAPDDALRLAVEVLERLGRVHRVGREEVRGMLGSGAMKLNPAVVDVHVGPPGRVRVRAAAKEGLIPQRTAQKAARQVISAMRLAYRAAPPS